MYDSNPVPNLEYYKCLNCEDLEKMKKKYAINPNVKIVQD